MSERRQIYEFEVLNEDLAKPRRVVESLFSSDQIETFAREGYCLVPGLFGPDLVESFRKAVDDVRRSKYGGSEESTYSSQSFAGQYLREPHLYDRRLWPLLERAPIIDTVRSMLGPRIVMRSFSARITFPQSLAGTKWHRDQRSMVAPAPALFTEPHVVTCLIYLDDVDEASGGTFVLPGTHRLLKEPPHERKFDPLPGELGFFPAAGSVLFLHSALWHRGGANAAGGRTRRLLIQQFAPAWAQKSAFESPLETSLHGELVASARNAGDEEMLEILGQGGYM